MQKVKNLIQSFNVTVPANTVAGTVIGQQLKTDVNYKDVVGYKIEEIGNAGNVRYKVGLAKSTGDIIQPVIDLHLKTSTSVPPKERFFDCLERAAGDDITLSAEPMANVPNNQPITFQVVLLLEGKV